MLVVYPNMRNEYLLIDFHREVSIDHQLQLFVEYDEESVVVHHSELLNEILDKFSPK
jgi:hypothetical protein